MQKLRHQTWQGRFREKSKLPKNSYKLKKNSSKIDPQFKLSKAVEVGVRWKQNKKDAQ